MQMTLRQLRHVLALEQHRSFARAAQSLGLTQPALSRSVQQLEKSIGATLFDRDRARVEPTLVGERLIDQARSLLNHADNVEKDLQQLLGLDIGLLRIGAGPYPADISVVKAVARMVRSRPGIRVDLSEDDWPSLTHSVVSGRIDMAIAETSLAVDDVRLSVEPLPMRQGMFFCRSGHPLATCSNPTLADVRRHPLVATSLPARLAQLTGSKNPEMTSSLYEAMSVPEIRVDSFDLVRRIVMESDAVGIAVLHQIRSEVGLGQLVALPLELPWIKTNYGIIRLANRTPSPAALTFLDVLREVESEIL